MPSLKSVAYDFINPILKSENLKAEKSQDEKSYKDLAELALPFALCVVSVNAHVIYVVDLKGKNLGKTLCP